MKLVGLMTVRNEEWVLGLSLRAALRFVDEAIVLDHASTDGTAEIVERIAAEHPGRVRLLREDDPVWREAALRQRLLEEGRAAGATHLCVLDADEVLTGNLLPEIRGRFASLRPGETLSLPWLALWRDLDAFRDDPSHLAQRSMVLGFRDAPALCYGPNANGLDFHTRRVRGAAANLAVAADRSGGVFHLAAVNRRRLEARTAWYKRVEAARFPGRRTEAERDSLYTAMYPAPVDEADLRLRPVPAEWWRPYLAWRAEIDLGGPAWFEGDCGGVAPREVLR